MKTAWKPARLVDLVNHLHDVVRLQYADMEYVTFDNNSPSRSSSSAVLLQPRARRAYAFSVNKLLQIQQSQNTAAKLLTM